MPQSPQRHRAKKSLGQNFLQDDNVCRKIVTQLTVGPDDKVIEIGPGQGALTRFIAAAGPKQYTVVEKDRDLAAALRTAYPDVDVVEADALEYPWADPEATTSCKIVGNLPYNIGSKLIWDIVSQAQTMHSAVFMVQHEVGLRLTAAPGVKAYGGLTAWVNNHCRTRYLFKVPPSVFRPQPKVDSAVISFTPLDAASMPDDPQSLSRLIKRLFQQRRKQVSTILKNEWSNEMSKWFERQELSPSIRPEKLTPAQMKSLAQVVRFASTN